MSGPRISQTNTLCGGSLKVDAAGPLTELPPLGRLLGSTGAEVALNLWTAKCGQTALNGRNVRGGWPVRSWRDCKRYFIRYLWHSGFAVEEVPRIVGGAFWGTGTDWDLG